MTRSALALGLAASFLLPAAASASATPEEMLEAMDVDPGLVVPGSVAAPDTQPGMFAALSSLGVISPSSGSTLAVMYTGNTDDFPGCTDHDWAPETTEAGDHVTLTFELDVPAGANSLEFRSYFLSREFPKWVGSQFNDVYSVTLEGDAYTGPIVFDAFGNEVTINSALFAVTDPASLAGTCFEEHGGTGWLSTVAPVMPSTTIRLTFEIWDVGDGIYDSLAIIDGFHFDDDEVDDPITDPVPTDPLRIAFVSPKEGPLEGGGEVTIHGYGFTESTIVLWNGEELTDLTLGTGGETLRVSDIPSVDEPSSIDIEVIRGAESSLLGDGYTYYDLAGGFAPPEILSVSPTLLWPDGGTEVVVTGTGFVSASQVVLLDADGIQPTSEADLFEAADGLQELYVTMPAHSEGWVDLLVRNPLDDGEVLESMPGFPVLYTYDAVNPGNEELRDGCSCSATGGTAGLGLLLLPLLGLARRRRG